MTAFNDYLKALREQKSLDIGTVAKRIGVHRHTQSNYEGHRDPPIDYLIEFAEVVDVPFTDILKKRLDDSKATEQAKNNALDSLNSVKSNDNTLDDIYARDNDLLQVKLSEVSHTSIPVDATVYIDTKDKSIAPGSMYGFLSPMNGCYFAAKLAITDTKLKLVFESIERKDTEFYIEDGSTESHYILKTLGLLGKVVKAEIVF
ncbi:helix-turn-helix domain-containing protein [Pseudoalteromonas sp. SR45-5]|uniref:helix-turn-helix domain-containing protein n=1 Tax=Pseudoalteromonas sp. SR45-5 TaxID=2760928 RepID=UPI0015FC87DD|nr:helix-turn-helix domain-containing protein [Pseudoalteromonas sp. SR45-5]MBB1354821.1 helix-turn-helix transcriptional regulator [Pseudoalteromonas sp. SR45-5]